MPLSLPRRKFLTYLGLGTLGWQTASFASRPSASPIIAPESKIITPETIATSANRLPEFQGISEWINSAPLMTKDLLGKVVLVQIWTLGCINCQRTLPYVTSWHKKYAAQGLQTIGIHTPEFAFERDSKNIRRAMTKYGITYPVGVDNNFQTWKAYKNEYWPHLFLADRQGIIRYDHIGEGAYAETEAKIRQLLGQAA
ncbi:redoxin domain-containing protein [Chamaesiphon sp.]|uniref:redoxin domain-containing protein n=1 Tax=Chamaesiphon sp. TaxID=2814140 RepID=UPI003592E9B7